MSIVSDSSVVFSITTSTDGKLKVSLDQATKANPVSPKRISPCPSLRSITTTDSEQLAAGFRRRVASISSQSIDSSDSFLYASGDESTDLNSSFVSCVSNLSIETCSSQETITNEPILQSLKLEAKKPIHETPPPKSYDQVHKERFGSFDDHDWRSVTRKHQEHKQAPPKPSRTPSTVSTSSSSSRRVLNSSATRIPSLIATRQATPPAHRPLPASRVNSTTSYAAVSAKPPSTTSEQTVKMSLKTGTDGKMRIVFSNPTNSESWIIDGIVGDSDTIIVTKSN